MRVGRTGVFTMVGMAVAIAGAFGGKDVAEASCGYHDRGTGFQKGTSFGGMAQKTLKSEAVHYEDVGFGQPAAVVGRHGVIVGAARTGGKEQIHVHAGHVMGDFVEKYPDREDRGSELAGAVSGPGRYGRQAKAEAEQKGEYGFHVVS